MIQDKKNTYHEMYRINIIQWIDHTIHYVSYDTIHIIDILFFFLNDDVVKV